MIFHQASNLNMLGTISIVLASFLSLGARSPSTGYEDIKVAEKKARIVVLTASKANHITGNQSLGIIADAMRDVQSLLDRMKDRSCEKEECKMGRLDAIQIKIGLIDEQLETLAQSKDKKMRATANQITNKLTRFKDVLALIY